MNKEQGLEIGRAAASADIAQMKALLTALIGDDDTTRRGTWAYYANKTLAYLNNEAPCFGAIWQLRGNNKLPFAFFSAMPDVTCSGAGPCLDWCYSFKSWRYPTAYFRQLINTLLMATEYGRQVISTATSKLPQNIAIRLYVDGDFADVAQVAFWMDEIRKRPDLSVYGYSKSWNELLWYNALLKPGQEWPTNYLLNLSNGGNA